jgi:23S rRNA (uracil1939-C5)-methyltransferase
MTRPKGPRVIDVEIDAVDSDGSGVAQFEGRQVHVKGVIPGQRVAVRVIKRRRGIWHALPEDTSSAAFCSAYPGCGGCSMQHLDPEAQLELKARGLFDQLARAGVVPMTVALPVRGPVLGYRRRARLGVRHFAGGRETLIGFRESFGSRIARASNCPVLVPRLQVILDELRTHVGALDGRAAVPQVELAAGDDGAAFIVRHLQPMTGADRARLRAVARRTGTEALLQHAGYDSVCRLDGGPPGPLDYRLDRFGLALTFAPIDFVQVNGIVNQMLVAEAVCDLDPDKVCVLDLFCGIGNFSLALARAGAEVIGIEGAPALVARARVNAERNGLTRFATFLAADLYKALPAAVRAAFGRCDRLLIDPPRSGLGTAIEHVRESRLSRIVYVSCHPTSFATDAAGLIAAGFTLSKLRLFDMFPHTAHVEVLGVFDRT